MSLRVLIYCDDPDNGGAAISTHLLALGLAARGYAVWYAQSRIDEGRVAERTAVGIEHCFIPYQTMKHYYMSTQDRRVPAEIIRASDPDIIVFADSAPDSTLGAKDVAAGLGIPYVAVKHMVLPHNPWTLAPTVRGRITRACALARKVVLVSEATRDLLCQDFAVDPAHTAVIPNGRPPVFFEPRSEAARAAVRRELDIPPDAFAVMTVAAISKLKGFDVLRQVVPRMVREGRIGNTVFVWIGDGEPEYLSALKTELAAAGAAPFVRFAGKRGDIPRCLDAADAFLLASQSESCPLGLIEAMAKGLPTVATEVGGIPEVLGGCGPLVTSPLVDPGRTAADIIGVLESWRANRAAARTVGEACAERARARYSDTRFIDRFAALIDQAALPAGDYVSPGLAVVKPDRRFPTLVTLDPERLSVAGARRGLPHNRYGDGRDLHRLIPNRDEAVLIHNLARPFAARRGLLVGADMGWTAAHIATAGVRLDILDSRLAEDDLRDGFIRSLAGLPAHLFVGAGAGALRRIAEREPEPWSFAAFNLPEPEPELGALAGEWLRHAADDAMLVLWNLLSSNAWGLVDPLRERGWRITLYDTAQMIAVATRGASTPVPHSPDPSVAWIRPEGMTG